MSTNIAESGQQNNRPAWYIKLLVSLVLLFHLSAILSHVLGAGGPFVMKQIASWYRPYLKTMWLDNAYRFYAPDPGPTEVLWYKLQYQDGSTRWTQLPRREDFYLRMPFQRHMSIALLASMMIEKEPINPKEDSASVANVLVNSQVTYRTVLTPAGEVYFRSYARHIGRREARHPSSDASLVAMDCYLVHYLIRTPFDMRMNIDMYDPRMLNIQFIATFSPDGIMSNFQQGFKERIADDLFIELVQNEILPMLERNEQLPAEKRKTIAQLLQDYGVPYPLIQPIVKQPAEEHAQFFKKPYDRDTLRERYAKALKLYDRPLQKPDMDLFKGDQPARSPDILQKSKATEPVERGIQ